MNRIQRNLFDALSSKYQFNERIITVSIAWIKSTDVHGLYWDVNFVRKYTIMPINVTQLKEVAQFGYTSRFLFVSMERVATQQEYWTQRCSPPHIIAPPLTKLLESGLEYWTAIGTLLGFPVCW